MALSLRSAGFCVSITEVPVARALLGVGERLRERLLGGLQLARRKRAIATFQVFGSLVLFAAVAAAGGAPAEALLAASGGACGSPSTRASTRAAIWLAPRLTCSKSRPSAELKSIVVSKALLARRCRAPLGTTTSLAVCDRYTKPSRAGKNHQK